MPSFVAPDPVADIIIICLNVPAMHTGGSYCRVHRLGLFFLIAFIIYAKVRSFLIMLFNPVLKVPLIVFDFFHRWILLYIDYQCLCKKQLVTWLTGLNY